LAQADAVPLVGGWSPAHLWPAGLITRDTYLLAAPAGSDPVAVQVALYRTDEAGQFVNNNWLSLSIR
jgi:hypothetical protein